MKYYKADPLVSYSDDEKCIKKAEKEVQREIEKKVASRKKSKSNGSYRRRRASPYPSDQPGPSHRWDMGQMPTASPLQTRPRVLRPCFQCGAFGHLAATCPAKEKLYLFCVELVQGWFTRSVACQQNTLKVLMGQ